MLRNNLSLGFFFFNFIDLVASYDQIIRRLV
jgi:hypothetical protein